jgi:hypothetical protein
VRNNHGGGYSYRLCPASEVRDSTHPFRQRFVLSQELCEREKPILNVPRQARDNHTREKKLETKTAFFCFFFFFSAGAVRSLLPEAPA